MLRPPEEVDFPKFLNWRYYVIDIIMNGMTDNYSSGPTERFNKEIKRAARCTNFNRHTLTQQVSCMSIHILVHAVSFQYSNVFKLCVLLYFTCWRNCCQG